MVECDEMRGLRGLVGKTERDPEILAAFLCGSRARGGAGPEFAADVCLALRRGIPKERWPEKPWEYMTPELDVHLFQSIPLWLRQRVLKEGKLLYVMDEAELYDLAIRTIKEWEGFKNIYYEHLEGSPMDRNRILAKAYQLQPYLAELAEPRPGSLSEFRQIEKKRACDRLAQIAAAAAIDICTLLVKGLGLGLPGEDDDRSEELEKARLISPASAAILGKMEGFRYILT